MIGVPQGRAMCLLDWVPASSAPNSLPALHYYKLRQATEFASVNVWKMKLVAAKRGASANTCKTYIEVCAMISSQSVQSLDVCLLTIQFGNGLSTARQFQILVTETMLVMYGNKVEPNELFIHQHRLPPLAH